MITIEGMSMKEYMEKEKHNPNSTNLIWEYQKCDVYYTDGRMENVNGSLPTGKVWYRGKSYEGEIEYRGNKLYVGGEFVKEV